MLCVRWYVRYALSYRDLEEMMLERGLQVDHTTIYRWMQWYAPELDRRCRPHLKPTTDSWRVDETYVKIKGTWTYLYRTVDSAGKTLEFLLSETRDAGAAKQFSLKVLGAAHTVTPRVITVDTNAAYPKALSEVKAEGTVPAAASFWVGLGGFDPSENLVQTGVVAHRVYVANTGWYTVYHAWVENLGYVQNPYENDLTNFSLGCNDLIFAQVHNGNCMYIQDITTGSNGNQCYGPNASTHTAEAIAERPDIDGSQQLLANFGSVTFLGTGITDNGSYLGMSQVNHDYTNLYSPNKSYTLATVGPIFYDANQNPPYDYTVTWQRYT